MQVDSVTRDKSSVLQPFVLTPVLVSPGQGESQMERILTLTEMRILLEECRLQGVRKLPFIVSHFDLPGPRYAVVKAQNGNFGDGSRTVWPATRAKSVKMVNTFSP